MNEAIDLLIEKFRPEGMLDGIAFDDFLAGADVELCMCVCFLVGVVCLKSTNI